MIYIITLINEYGLKPGVYKGEWTKKKLRIEGCEVIIPMPRSTKTTLEMTIVVKENMIDIYEGIKAQDDTED